jgi:SAM-dependent methyltransferase
MLSDDATEILDAARRVLAGQPAGAPPPGLSERIIETPWVASYFKGGERVLDIGFTMSSLDYLGLLLELRRDHRVTVEAADIVKPERVARRYPEAWLADVLATPITIGDVRTLALPEGRYDVVTCISTIEHIGFDAATYDDPKTAFARSATPEGVVLHRDAHVNRDVLAQFHRALRPGGLALISVPMGKGGPALLKDSLDLYCAQWEYEAASWREITGADGFELVEQRFVRLDPDRVWRDVAGPAELTGQSSELQPHAAGCALAALRRR